MGIVENMFYSYDNLPVNYIPDNSSPPPAPQIIINNDLPKLCYNIKHDFIGYGWKYGDKFNLKLSISYDIKVDPNSLIYNEPNEGPDINTCGVIGMKAYNTVDCKSWTYIQNIGEDAFLWVEDPYIMYPINGTCNLKLIPKTENTTLTCDIYNFRWEKIFSQSINNSPLISISVDEDFNKLFVPETYHCQLKLTNNNINSDVKTSIQRDVNLIVS